GRRFASVTNGGVEFIPEGQKHQSGIELELKQKSGAVWHGLNGAILMFPMQLKSKQRGEFVHPRTILITPEVEIGLRRLKTKNRSACHEASQCFAETFAIILLKPPQQTIGIGGGDVAHFFTRVNRSIRY